MKVHELIAALQQQDPDLEVVLPTGPSSLNSVADVSVADLYEVRLLPGKTTGRFEPVGEPHDHVIDHVRAVVLGSC